MSPDSRRGMMIIEYIVLTIVVIAALMTMGVYLKRGLSGKWREAADGIGYGKQYEPGRTTKNGKLF